MDSVPLLGPVVHALLLFWCIAIYLQVEMFLHEEVEPALAQYQDTIAIVAELKI